MAEVIQHTIAQMKSKTQPVNKLLANAFLSSLDDDKLELLRRVAVNSGEILNWHFTTFPALFALCEQSEDGKFHLIASVKSVLVEGLSETQVSGNDVKWSETAHDTPWSWLNANGGVFMALTKGVAAADQIENQLPNSLMADHLGIGLFKVVNALKSGDLARADALMAVLSEYHEIPEIGERLSIRNPELVCVIYMKAIYADVGIADIGVERLLSVLSELPKDAFLLRAILYNVSLDVFLRRNELSMAQQSGQRALFHYRAAEEAGVGFYVYLYLVVIGLHHGDIEAVEANLLAATAALNSFQGATNNDFLLLRSFELIWEYETRNDDTFVRHLLYNEDTIPYGEIWPAMAEPIINYGRLALTSKVSPIAALSWVRKWRLRQRRSKRFDALVSVQEVLALQDAGRWQEADELLPTIDDFWGGELKLAKLAAALDKNPKSLELGAQFGKDIGDDTIAKRQRVKLCLMFALYASGQKRELEAARQIRHAIDIAQPIDLPALWNEQHELLAKLFTNRSLRHEIQKQPQLWRQMEKLLRSKAPQGPKELTRQEYRVLLLLAEAQSNKAIGLRLGITQPTVKFHIGNLFRKTDKTKRKDVVSFAIEAGWIATDHENIY